MDLKQQPKTKDLSKSSLGLDIGSFAVKALEISGPPDKPVISAIGLKEIAGSASAALSTAIKSLVQESGISSREAAISVEGQAALVRFITMPKMREEELRSAVSFEAEKFIPFNIKECVLDFQIINKDSKDSKWQMVLVAAKKSYVTDRIKIAEDAGLSVKIVDVDTFAVANAFLKNFPQIAPDKTCAVVNIGARLANVCVCRAGMPHFVRDIAIEKPAEAAPSAAAPQGQEAAKPVAPAVIDEMRLSFSYYENQNGRGVDEIYISGGASSEAIEHDVEEAFGVKPVMWDPLAFADPSASAALANLPQGSRKGFAVAAGLALRK